jgi:uncharacterized coiled-coil protein SlyX
MADKQTVDARLAALEQRLTDSEEANATLAEKNADLQLEITRSRPNTVQLSACIAIYCR